jgi:hypothetical protein
MASVRLPRFKRNSNVRSFRLTERDWNILRLVYEHRFLRSNHLISLISGSSQQISRRLQLLYQHGFLERPRCQIDYYYEGGSRRIAYGIAAKGAAALRRKFSVPYSGFAGAVGNSVKRLFLEHALMISDFMVALELSCQNRPNVQLLKPSEIAPDIHTEGVRNRFQWKVNVQKNVDCGVIPDKIFGLEFTDDNGRKRKSWFCVEADRETMPVARANLHKSSFVRKLLGYSATWSQELHRIRFGWPRFRVLTVTTSQERVDNLIDAARQLKHGQGLFLFTDLDSLSSNSDLLSLKWRTVRSDLTAKLLE